MFDERVRTSGELMSRVGGNVEEMKGYKSETGDLGSALAGFAICQRQSWGSGNMLLVRQAMTYYSTQLYKHHERQHHHGEESLLMHYKAKLSYIDS